ncbi:MAG TPA: PQQ-binding-like beta-propeller repeat protein [Myxococcales bacterium]|nr:PQQ-binding-like beta-propeller repeat protein [Myxococcales bacterium]
MLLALLAVAFSSAPLDHAPRGPQRDARSDRPFFVGEMQRIVPPDRVEWNPSETATPAIDEAETRLYLATHDGKVRCRFRGKTAWTFQTNGPVLAAPTLSEETLVVAGGDGVLYGLNRFTGAARWQTDLHEELTTSPVVADGRVFVMSSEQSVTAVNVKDGKSLWKMHRDPPGGYSIRGDAPPRVAHGTVFVGFADGTVAALQPQDGVVKWSKQVSGTGEYLDVDWIDAPENDPRIYVASAKAGVVAVDAATGEPAWTSALPGANHVLVEGPRVIAGGRGAVVALDRGSGKLLWTLKLPKDHYPTQPVVVNGIVLVADDRGPLMGVDAQTGEARGGFDPGSGFSQPVLALPGVAYVISNGGALYALGLLP